MYIVQVAKKPKLKAFTLRVDEPTRRIWQRTADAVRDGNVSMTVRLAMAELAERTSKKEGE